MADDRTDKLLRKSYQEIQQLRAALREAKSAGAEPIAIIGMACRAPGGVVDPAGFWALLEEGRDAIGLLPPRCCGEHVHAAGSDVARDSHVCEGGFLDDVDRFDAACFGISAQEAAQMDPQQRLMLEVAWEALERSGMAPSALGESRTGVFVGAMGTDYGLDAYSLEALDGYQMTGTASSVLSGRVSYSLGLQGPALTVDTACSSSLVALHLACSSLRSGECDLALSGGVTVMCTPRLLVEFSRLGASAPDGRCKSFGESANGAGWSEGCGVVVLKRLSDAQRQGDRILAVIRGSAVNQDGRSQGLTAPNGPSQTRLIRRALEVSGLTPADIDAIEAHGTGTSLGDPIEANALAQVFAAQRSARPVWLGSSKSNIGHSQAAAGVLGLIKMVLALQHSKLPKTLHAERPSTKVDWESSGLSLLQQLRAWPREEDHVRRAGVSSFGISGTNAHVILEEAPAAEMTTPLAVDAAIPLLLSANDESALREQAAAWQLWLQQHPEVPWRDVLETAALRRSHLRVRAAVAANGRVEALPALQALANGQTHPLLSTGDAAERSGVVFVFPGQGSQWPAMGRALMEQSPIFLEAVQACDAALQTYTGWSVLSALRGDVALDTVDVIQPALFAMSIALAAVWRSLGMEPAAVVGHSQGEIAAAVVCGALSLEEGARVVTLRSRLLRRLAGRGAMAMTELPVEVVQHRLAESRFAGLAVAVVNTSTSTVVAGTPESIERWVKEQATVGVFCRRIAVDYASHSGQVDGVLGELATGLQGLKPRAGQLPMISTVSGFRPLLRPVTMGSWS